MPHPTLREQRALTAARVLDQYRRTGSVPAELVLWVRAEVARRGRLLTEEQARDLIADHVEAWAEVFLREDDAKRDSRAEKGRRLRERAADLARERAERARHVPKVMITKE